MRVLFAAACIMAAVAAMAQGASASGEMARKRKEPVLKADMSAPDVLAKCRGMLPSGEINLQGALILRNRKGIVQDEYDYELDMLRPTKEEEKRGKDETELRVRLYKRNDKTKELASVNILRRGNAQPTIGLTKDGKKQEIGSPLERVMGTDVTWLDLTFDFLWWTDARYEKEREGETVHGQVCVVICVYPPTPIAGLEAVRLWVDKKSGCLMQAEQLGEGMKPLRRLWGSRVKKFKDSKKFKDRWMVSVLEVETFGLRQRTKITVEPRE